MVGLGGLMFGLNYFKGLFQPMILNEGCKPRFPRKLMGAGSDDFYKLLLTNYSESLTKRTL